jgi:hypothetical protein
MITTKNGRLMMAAMFGAMLVFGTIGSPAQGPAKGYIKPVNASDKFHIGLMENANGEMPSSPADLKALLATQKNAATPAERKEKNRTRGDFARDQCGVGDYKGICDLWEFDNDDFPVNNTTCGQAAAATIIAHWKHWHRDDAAKATLTSFLYRNYGPDNGLGYFGTSWQRVVNSITGPYQMSWRKSSGEDDLRAELNKGIPVIVVLDAERLRQRGYSYPRATVGVAAHYVVVYGYDSGFYFVTNHDQNWIARKDFLESWNTWIHGAIDGGNRGYVFWK